MTVPSRGTQLGKADRNEGARKIGRKGVLARCTSASRERKARLISLCKSRPLPARRGDRVTAAVSVNVEDTVDYEVSFVHLGPRLAELQR
jgi:hypothetical protein